MPSRAGTMLSLEVLVAVGDDLGVAVGAEGVAASQSPARSSWKL